MGMQLPDWARELFLVVVGDGWPEVDEDELWALSQEWAGIAGAVYTLQYRITEPVRAIRRTNWDGLASDAFAAAGGSVLGEGGRQLSGLAAGAQELADFIYETGVNVQYMKIIVIEELAILAAQIAYLITMAPWTSGASAAAVPALEAWGQFFATSMLRQLIISIGSGQVLQVGLDAIDQLLQIAIGVRKRWDVDLTKYASITGAVGSAIGPLVHGMTGKLIGKELERLLGKHLTGGVREITTNAMHEFGTSGATGLVTGQGWTGQPWDLTAGATDGAVQVGGRHLKHRFGGAPHAPEINTDKGQNEDNLPGNLPLLPAPEPSRNAGTGGDRRTPVTVVQPGNSTVLGLPRPLDTEGSNAGDGSAPTASTTVDGRTGTQRNEPAPTRRDTALPASNLRISTGDEEARTRVRADPAKLQATPSRTVFLPPQNTHTVVETVAGPGRQWGEDSTPDSVGQGGARGSRRSDTRASDAPQRRRQRSQDTAPDTAAASQRQASQEVAPETVQRRRGQEVGPESVPQQRPGRRSAPETVQPQRGGQGAWPETVPQHVGQHSGTDTVRQHVGAENGKQHVGRNGVPATAQQPAHSGATGTASTQPSSAPSETAVDRDQAIDAAQASRGLVLGNVIPDGDSFWNSLIAIGGDRVRQRLGVAEGEPLAALAVREFVADRLAEDAEGEQRYVVLFDPALDPVAQVVASGVRAHREFAPVAEVAAQVLDLPVTVLTSEGEYGIGSDEAGQRLHLVRVGDTYRPGLPSPAGPLDRTLSVSPSTSSWTLRVGRNVGEELFTAAAVDPPEAFSPSSWPSSPSSVRSSDRDAWSDDASGGAESQDDVVALEAALDEPVGLPHREVVVAGSVADRLAAHGLVVRTDVDGVTASAAQASYGHYRRGEALPEQSDPRDMPPGAVPESYSPSSWPSSPSSMRFSGEDAWSDDAGGEASYRAESRHEDALVQEWHTYHGTQPAEPDQAPPAEPKVEPKVEPSKPFWPSSQYSEDDTTSIVDTISPVARSLSDALRGPSAIRPARNGAAEHRSVEPEAAVDGTVPRANRTDVAAVAHLDSAPQVRRVGAVDTQRAATASAASLSDLLRGPAGGAPRVQTARPVGPAAAQPAAAHILSGRPVQASTSTADSTAIDQFLTMYAGARAELGEIALSNGEVRDLVSELMKLAGDHGAPNVGVLDDPAIGRQLARLRQELAAHPGVRSEGLLSAVNTLLLSAAVLPQRAGLPVVSGSRLETVLRQAVDNVAAGRDPMVHNPGSRSSLATIGYGAAQPVVERVARLALVNVSPRARADVLSGGLFDRLVRSGLAAEALSTVGGVEGRVFPQTSGVAAMNQVVRAQVPTVAGLVVVGRRLAAEIDRRLEALQLTNNSVPARTERRRLSRASRTVRQVQRYLRAARTRLDAIERAAGAVVERFERSGDRAAAHRALAELTQRWSAATQKLSVLSALDERADPSTLAQIPVLHRQRFPGSANTSQAVASVGYAVSISATLGLAWKRGRMRRRRVDVPAEQYARALEGVVLLPPRSEAVSLAPLVSDGTARRRLWLAVHRAPGQSIVVETTHGRPFLLATDSRDLTPVFVVTDPLTVSSTVVPSTQLGHYLAEQGIVRAYLPGSPARDAVRQDRTGAPGDDLSVERKEDLIDQTLEAGSAEAIDFHRIEQHLFDRALPAAEFPEGAVERFADRGLALGIEHEGDLGHSLRVSLPRTSVSDALPGRAGPAGVGPAGSDHRGDVPAHRQLVDVPPSGAVSGAVSQAVDSGVPRSESIRALPQVAVASGTGGAPSIAVRSSFVVVANRLPVHQVTTPEGKEWRRSPGGLVTALHPVLARRRGAWVGWTGGVGQTSEPFDLDGIRIQPVPLSTTDIEFYYNGQSNATLWPLYHDAVETPLFKQRWSEAYQSVNARFAEATAEVAAEGATVWVHDYHLQLVPAVLRDLRPDLRIGFFLHIPLPPIELFMRMPLRAEVVRGLLGADLVGFQQPLAAENFVRLAGHMLKLSHEGQTIQVDGRRVKADAFPISIDVAEMEHLAADPTVQARAREIRARLGAQTVILGVDRLDYTKGIELRLNAFRELLADRKLTVPETVMVQVATPSREDVKAYQELRERVEREVGRINGAFARTNEPALHYLYQSFGRRELAALYCAADVMMVTPLRDGMNLVAKEYVACRADAGGALVLSEFAGAATELHEAFQCNPYDIESVKDALMRAVHVDGVEARERMLTMQQYLRAHDVRQWAHSFLTELGVHEAGPDDHPSTTREDEAANRLGSSRSPAFDAGEARMRTTMAARREAGGSLTLRSPQIPDVTVSRHPARVVLID